MTARYLDSELRNQLVAKREADLRTEAERERLRRQWATQESPTLLSRMAPAILAPANGTGVLPHTIVPIKLTPPPPWSTTEVDIITGKPIQKPVPVSNYALRLERRDPADNWAAPPPTVAVGITQTHSPVGYTDWGADRPDGRALPYLAFPGTWRVSAHVAAATQSGWSDWVEFAVVSPPAQNQLQPRPKLFRK